MKTAQGHAFEVVLPILIPISVLVQLCEPTWSPSCQGIKYLPEISERCMNTCTKLCMQLEICANLAIIISPSVTLLCKTQHVSGEMKPSQFDLSRQREHHLTAHNIPVTYSQGMKVVQSFGDLRNDEGYLLLLEGTRLNLKHTRTLKNETSLNQS